MLLKVESQIEKLNFFFLVKDSMEVSEVFKIFSQVLYLVVVNLPWIFGT